MISEVKIFNIDDYTTLFASANLISINIRDEHKATTFQIESGESRSDHVVVQAVEISIELLLIDDENTFTTIEQYYQQNKLVGIQTRVKTYQPMLLVNLNHQQSADITNGINLSLHFIEWREVTPLNMVQRE